VTVERVDRARLKAELVRSLRQTPKTQVASVQSDVRQALGGALNAQDAEVLLELIHEFIVSNVLMTAMNKDNIGWPWLGVTSHGAQVLGSEGPPVYDHDGYLAELDSRVADLDSVVRRYISESLQAFQRNLFYASVVMLGCASERAIRLLIEAYVNAIDDEKNRAKLQGRIGNRDISTAYSEFRKSFDSTRSSIPKDTLSKDFDIHVDSVFTFARLLRNSIVHPDAMPNVTSAMATANLQQFSYYVECVFMLIKHYGANRVTV